MKLKGKNILLIGLKKSGEAALNFLLKRRAKVFIYDDDKKVLNDFIVLDNNVIKVDKITEEFLTNINLVVISPGVSKYNESVKLAMLLNIKVIGELELGLNFIKGNLIAITGSNGKTTTVNLVEQAFNYDNKKNRLVGNVGNPITENIDSFRTNYIAEVSSFQLECSSVKPHIACILNLSQNHLDRHFSFKEYRETKFKIFENMKRKDILVLNTDDRNLLKLKEQNLKPKLIWFSLKKEILGAFLKENKIYYKTKKQTSFVCDTSEIKLLGKHNIANILAFIAICMSAKISLKAIRSVITNFRGVEHRLEFIENINGVDFINDSKSTTPDAMITAVGSVKKPIILILGGSDKGLNYDDAIKRIGKKIKLAVLTGDIRNKLKKSFEVNNLTNFVIKKDFYYAVKYAKSIAEKGDTVLLSPATASFDYFENFEERGKAFVKIIKDDGEDSEK